MIVHKLDPTGVLAAAAELLREQMAQVRATIDDGTGGPRAHRDLLRLARAAAAIAREQTAWERDAADLARRARVRPERDAAAKARRLRRLGVGSP